MKANRRPAGHQQNLQTSGACLWHFRELGAHRATEDPKVTAAHPEVRGDRKTVWPCSDDGYMALTHYGSPLGRGQH